MTGLTMAALLFPEDFHAAPDECIDLEEGDRQSGYKSWTIGRHSDCDAQIKDPQVSGVHAVISRKFIKKQRPLKGYLTAFYIEDQGSRNGVYLNARRLKPYDPEPLHPQDKISFGWPEGRAVFLLSCMTTANAMAWEQPGWPTYRKKEVIEGRFCWDCGERSSARIARHYPRADGLGDSVVRKEAGLVGCAGGGCDRFGRDCCFIGIGVARVRVLRYLIAKPEGGHDQRQTLSTHRSPRPADERSRHRSSRRAGEAFGTGLGCCSFCQHDL